MVRVAVTGTTAELPIIVAQDEGIFKAHGLDVKILQAQGGGLAPIGKQYDIGQTTGTDIVQAVNGGLDLRLISTVAQEVEPATSVMVPAGSNIKSIKDLAGKRIAVITRSAVISQSLVFLLKQAGVPESAVKLQETPFPTMVDLLKSGKVDAAAAPAPFTGQMAAAGATSLGNPILEAGRSASPGSTIITLFATTSRQWAESHPSQIKAWRASLEQATGFIKSNESRARADLQKYTGLPAAVVNASPLYTYPSGAVSPSEIALYVPLCKGSGALPENSNVKTDDLVVK